MPVSALNNCGLGWEAAGRGDPIVADLLYLFIFIFIFPREL